MRFIIAIPARLESKRLPNKVILDIEGKSMIQRVIDRCKKCQKISSVILCTDNEILRKIGDNSNNYVLSFYTWESITEKMSSYLDKFIKK